MSYLENFPDKERLLGAFDEERNGFPMKINGHIHSPYSFSAFKSIAEAVRLAALEDVMVLGINDFYMRDGFAEFIQHPSVGRVLSAYKKDKVMLYCKGCQARFPFFHLAANGAFRPKGAF